MIWQEIGANGLAPGSSLLEVSNIAYVNFSGYMNGAVNNTALFTCSKVHPCFNIVLQNISLADSDGKTPYGAHGSCTYVAANGIRGVTGNGCPSA
jgi:galacturan 1,4-alpha-galacturonidase